MTIFTGSGVAIVTPFTKEGVNFEKLGELLDWQIEQHTDAIIICGTTGEASTMTFEERKSVIKYTVDRVRKRIPVIAGTGTNNTVSAIENSKMAESCGVDGLLVVTPYYNKTNKKGLIKYFSDIANSVSIPIVLYNVPSRTNMNIPIDSYAELIKIPNIVAVKEASGSLPYASKLKYLYGDKLDIYSGNDGDTFVYMSIGARGVISTCANIIPQEMHDICKLFIDGNYTASRDLQFKILALIDSIFLEVNPIPLKTAMNLMGLNVGNLRAPLYSMDDENLKLLKQELNSFGLI